MSLPSSSSASSSPPLSSPESSQLLTSLLDKAQAILNKTIHGKGNNLSSLSSSSPSTSSSSSSKSTRRLTEKEEDSILLQSSDDSDEDLSQIFHLTQQPPTITGNMRPYQLEGLNWLIRLWRVGVSGILADEMGLGKTLQTISLMAYLRLHQKVNGPFVILTPLSTLGNWEREINRWCPEIKVFKFHGNKEQRLLWIKQGIITHKDSRGKGKTRGGGRKKKVKEEVEEEEEDDIVMDNENDNNLYDDNEERIESDSEEGTKSPSSSSSPRSSPLPSSSPPPSSSFESNKNDPNAMSDENDNDNDNDIEEANASPTDPSSSSASPLPSSSSPSSTPSPPPRDNHDPDWDVLLTTYEMAISEKAQLKKTPWEYIIVDEAHRLKNENSLLSQIVRFLDSKFRLLLTGTPLQNNLHELWALLNFLMPKVFHSSLEFDSMFASADTESNNGQHLLQQLHTILRPFMLRRLKKEALADLLPKKETLIYVGMTEKQTQIYKGILSKDIEVILGKTKERARLMNTIMQLRKTTNHPYLFEGVEDPEAPPYGDHLITHSGKMLVLDKLLLHLFARGSRVLIFSQMTRTLDILDDYCIYRGFRYCRIDGSTDTIKREEMMKEFNEDHSTKQLFLLSTRAGGLGINLHTADVVILYDSDWNPQMDNQAIDRAHRIGQTKQVYVYRLVTENTIEEKIIERAEIKLRLDAMVVQAGRGAMKKKTNTQGISNDDASQMIRYGADRIIRSKGGTVTDEDIERILERGEMKTAELAEKLKNHLNRYDFSLDGKGSILPTNPNSENDEGKDELQEFNLQLINSVQEALGQRQRKVTSFNESFIFKEMSGKNPKSCLTKPFKIPPMKDFQLFNKERIEELSTKEWKFYERYQWDPTPPTPSGLNENERKEMQMLLDDGFGEWNFGDFVNYIRAVKRYGRNNLPKIVEMMSKHQPAPSVTRYHIKFCSLLTSGEDLMGKWTSLKGNIEVAEKRIEVNSAYESTLDEFLSAYSTRHDMMNHLRIVYTNNNREDRGFTDQSDRWILSVVKQCGYGNWKKVVKEIHSAPNFHFDYYLRSKNWADIKRRTDILLREIMRDKKRKEKEKEEKETKEKKSKESEEEKKINPNSNDHKVKEEGGEGEVKPKGRRRGKPRKDEGKEKEKESKENNPKKRPRSATTPSPSPSNSAQGNDEDDLPLTSVITKAKGNAKNNNNNIPISSSGGNPHDDTAITDDEDDGEDIEEEIQQPAREAKIPKIESRGK